eukprot:TRINITY_DN14461_c0_g1_i1.p1 TRINITY_DN14461_c0_g1~~TRINITY_DN14461_c0_g1_i1.p1  ORF type:complete len:685 (+),score=211.66 TRINITY_DN14461_c0_g1_i1:89-2056(+)
MAGLGPIELADVGATEDLGASLAAEAQRGDVIFLEGDLGAGKTSLARGFVRSFFHNPTLDVPSPTYLLHFIYKDEGGGGGAGAAAAEEAATAAPAAEPDGKGHAFRAGRYSALPGVAVHHFDPYRLKEGRIAALVDFAAVWRSDISLVEWPERLGEQLVSADSPSRLVVRFLGTGLQGQGRRVELSAVGPAWAARLARWEAAGKVPAAPPAGGAGDGAEGHTAGAPPDRPLNPLPAAPALKGDPREWRVLGIESSCDDTGAAVVRGDGQILGESLASQNSVHEQWGGVVPKLAQEAHAGAIDATVEDALRKAGVTDPAQLDAVAVTVGPGLGPCLQVGVKKAYALAAAARLPIVRVHHMEAHAMVTRMPGLGAADPPPFPYVTLLVSGGHNLALLSTGLGHHTILGSTLDDSVGEAFDKTARMLGITAVPGGPALERLAEKGDPNRFKLPKPLSKTSDAALRDGCDYSFSGLKTATRQLKEAQLGDATPGDQAHADLAAAFQARAVDHLVERAGRAIQWARELRPDLTAVVVAGGVAANKRVRAGFKELAERHGLPMLVPPPRLCVDNGVMVAWAGHERLREGLCDAPPTVANAGFFVDVLPRWPLGPRDPRSRPKPSGRPAQQKRKRAQEDQAGGAGQPPPAKRDQPAASAAEG